MKQTILRNFIIAKEEKADRVIIYYSGHGDVDTGGWITYGGSIGINSVRLQMHEVLNIV